MNTRRFEKLKIVVEAVPAGFLVDADWLTAQNITRFHTRGYVENGWLERVARGVFRRPVPEGTPLDWRTCLLSVQHIMNHKIHVGGTTALALHGYSHYLPLSGNMSVWIYGEKVPTWLDKLPLDAKIITRNASLFADPTLGLTTESTTKEDSPLWNWPLVMSSLERAIFEALDELPTAESFHNLDM